MRLRWTKNAVADLEQARLYIANENPSAAKNIIDRIEKALSTLLVYPEAGKSGRCKGTRELVIPGTPFIVPYRIRNQAIEILAVIHHSRIWPDGL